MSYDTDQTLL